MCLVGSVALSASGLNLRQTFSTEDATCSAGGSPARPMYRSSFESRLSSSPFKWASFGYSEKFFQSGARAEQANGDDRAGDAKRFHDVRRTFVLHVPEEQDLRGLHRQLCNRGIQLLMQLFVKVRT